MSRRHHRARRRPSSRRPASLAERARLFLPLRSWRVQLIGAVVAIIVAIFTAQSLASAAAAGPMASYLIQTGDTLLGIAANTGVPLDRLVAVNGIKDPDVIIAGQTLQLDASTTPTAAPAAATPASSAGPHYTVKAGDTLWDIARAANVSLDSIAQLNGLSNVDQLTVGEQLRMPAPAGQTAATLAAPKKPKPASSLAQKLAADAQRIAGPDVRVGVAATNLVSGEKVGLHADDAFPSASVMKLPILVELERQVSSGTLSWSDGLRSEASAMIAVSDNSAANQIAQAIHPQSVNDTMTRLGLGATRFMNFFDGGLTSAKPGENETTPSNMARLLELIANDQVVNAQVSGDIRALLARNTDGSKLARLLPSDARVAHKSGWFDGVANDVGIVTVDRVPARWVVAVFTQNIHDPETGNQLIAALSKDIYAAWAP